MDKELKKEPLKWTFPDFSVTIYEYLEYLYKIMLLDV